MTTVAKKAREIMAQRKECGFIRPLLYVGLYRGLCAGAARAGELQFGA